MVKRKMKKAVKQKQKQKQNVNVKQNVKVVVGEIKKKRSVKSSGAKSGAGAKPPIVLNISQPQPYNNPYMEYFKQQLQNQQPVKANTLAQHERINEREETKASRVGALHHLDQEPDDVAREMNRQEERLKASIRQSQAERKAEEREMVGSIKKIPKEPKQTQVAPKLKQPAINPPLFQMQQQQAIAESIASNLEQRQRQMEERMMNPFEALEEEETRFYPPEEQPTGRVEAQPAEEEWTTIVPKKKKRGSKPYTEEQKPEAKQKRGRPIGSKNKPKQ